jgi:hypothetical protein
MKQMIAALLDRIRGTGSSDQGDIVRRSCIDAAAEPPATKAPPIAVSYFIKVRNIGDLVSPIAVQYATGRPTVWKTRAAGEHLLGIGSILHWARPLSHVWGTGLMNPAHGIGGLEGERIWALRGKLTYSCLKPELAGLRDVPLGDPGYLIGRRLAALRPPRAPTHRVGIVPHFLDRDHPGIAFLRGQDGVMILDVRDPPPAFFAQMMACEAIASSSLHGLVLAEALGIPNVWLDFRPESPDREFKYHDWFTLAEQPQAAPLRVDREPKAADVVAATTLHEVKIDERALGTAVPRAVLDDLSVAPRKAPRIVHVLTSRRKPLPIFLRCGNLGHRLHDLAAAYRKQSARTELVLIDGGDSGDETQAAIGQLQQEGALVRVVDPGTPDQQAKSLQHVIRLYFKHWGEPRRFAIASGAVDFSATSPDAFALYDELLDRFERVDGVGPMLRIQDLPFGYPALGGEITEHWLQERSVCETSLGPVGVVQTSLIGNFALCRADDKHPPPRTGLRVHHPFDARDLDWIEPATHGQRPVRRLYW